MGDVQRSLTSGDRLSDCSVQKSLEPAVHSLEGQKVTLHSLQSAAELNGQTATCIKFDESDCRWEIRLENGELKRVRPENFTRMDVQTSSRSVDSDECALEAGEIAVLHSLVGAAHLNGELVTCIDFVESTGRWLVTLKSGEEKNVKPENLASRRFFGRNGVLSEGSAQRDVGKATLAKHATTLEQSHTSLSSDRQSDTKKNGSKVALRKSKAADSLTQNSENGEQKDSRTFTKTRKADRIWSRTFNQESRIAAAAKESDDVVTSSLRLETSILEENKAMPPLVCLPISSGKWGEFQFAADDPYAPIYTSPTVSQKVNATNAFPDMRSLQRGLRKQRAGCIKPRQNRKGEQKTVEEVGLSSPPEESERIPSKQLERLPLADSLVQADSPILADLCVQTLQASAASPSRSRSRSRSRSQSARSIATPSPVREGRTYSNHVQLPRRRVLSEDVDDCPFPFLVPGSEFTIQCDGCAKWLEVHEEIHNTYGKAINCPFFCSCVGLPVCAGEDPDTDDIEYMTLVKTARIKKLREYREANQV
mmetsp:Transcript_66077/g.103174  ORF Transcript_66077/g.103174 Transcript_66077/m.103174 type:complete len:537 (+) Transcript_66077:84-1694(+)